MSTVDRTGLKDDVMQIFAEGAHQLGHDVGHVLRSAELANRDV